MTSSHSALFKTFNYDTVFLDEASQVPLYRAVTIFTSSVRRVILAGDHHQLPGIVSDKGVVAKLDVSLMEFMIKKGYPTTFLDTQRRGHPDIFAFSSKKIYGDKLKSAYVPSPPTLRSLFPVIIRSVEGFEEKVGTSWTNEKEAKITAAKWREMCRIYPDCVVIVPYVGQRDLLKKRGVDVHTVDSFQGKEAACVIVATVRKNPEGRIGFWKDERRLNVALTRAKHQLILIGSTSTWKSSKGIVKEMYKHFKLLMPPPQARQRVEVIEDVFKGLSELSVE
jgi:superfamily I DNA and/or RNA helicase